MVGSPGSGMSYLDGFHMGLEQSSSCFRDSIWRKEDAGAVGRLVSDPGVQTQPPLSLPLRTWLGWMDWVCRNTLLIHHAQVLPTTPPSRPLPVQIIQVNQYPGMTWGPWFRARGAQME